MSATAAETTTPDPTGQHERILERARNREEPSRTRSLRQTYAQKLRGAWDRIRAAAREGIVENNALGLQTEALADVPTGGDFEFDTDAQKVEAFRRWLDRQTQADILRQVGDENQFIARAYEKGVENAHTELRALGLTEGDVAATATQLPVHREQLQRLYARNFRALEGMTEATGREMSRVLSEGLASGDGPEDIARDLADRIDKVGRTRATTIARSEVMNSHNAGRLQEWERAGVQQVGVLIAGDACPQCQAYKAGEPYPATDAYGNLPKHPNCRCSHHVWTGEN